MLRRTVLEAPCWTHISRGDAVLPPDPQAACARGNREPNERTVRDTAAVRRLVAVRERSAAPTRRPPRTLGLV